MPFDWKSVPPPPAVASLPRDARGFPVPVVTPRHEGKYEFGAISAPRIVICGGHRLCGVCGAPLGDDTWVVSDGEDIPLDVLVAAVENGDEVRNMAPQAEAPVHAECGFYAAAVCPYLARPTARRSTDTVLDPRGSLRPETVQLRRVDGYSLVESPEFGFGFQYGRVLEVVVVEAEVQAAQRLATLMSDLPARAPAPTVWTSGADGVIREAQRVIRRLFPHLAASLASPVPPTPRGDARRSKRKAQGAARKAGRKKR